jgi:hypothetical protein
MMDAYDLPTSLTIGEVDYSIRFGWRAVMDIFAALNDPDLDEEMKTEAMCSILYPDWLQIPLRHRQEAIQKACDFLDCGVKPDGKHRPRTMDWTQDAALIIPAVNAVANREIRMDPNIHWWTFFGWYMAVGEGLFASVLHIRQKKAKGKKLEKHEEEFYRDNRHLIELRKAESEEVRREKENLLKWL